MIRSCVWTTVFPSSSAEDLLGCFERTWVPIEIESVDLQFSKKMSPKRWRKRLIHNLWLLPVEFYKYIFKGVGLL